MPYATPELVLLGAAPALVLGGEEGGDDNSGSPVTKNPFGLAVGLDE